MKKTNSDNKEWEIFCSFFKKSWLKFDHKKEILDILGGDESLAMVVIQVSDSPEQWLSTRVPALNGKTPLWCLQHGRKNQLKKILMQMPR